MDAPIWEELIRVLLALVMSAAGIALFIDWRRSRALSISPLLAYKAGTVIAYAVWRWAIVWIGLQLDAGTDYSRDIEPYIRSIGNVLLLLVGLGMLLVAFFHARGRR